MRKRKSWCRILDRSRSHFPSCSRFRRITRTNTNSEVAIKDLYIGAKEVTLESRVLNISPTKQFTKKDGSSFSLRTITVYDNNSTASVKLWDEKANLPGTRRTKTWRFDKNYQGICKIRFNRSSYNKHWFWFNNRNI